MDRAKIDRLCSRETPPAEWQELVESLTGEEAREVEDRMNAEAQRCAQLATYVMYRKTTGCGDQGHRTATREMENVRAGVRKALGYSYPRM